MEVWRETDAAELTPFRRRVGAAAGVFVAGIGMLVLAGWIFGVVALTRLAPGMVTMKANSAIGFVACGMALWLGTAHRSSSVLRAGSRGLAIGAVLIGAATMVEYLSGHALGIDQLLFLDRGSLGSSTPGRMSPPAAACLVLVGSAVMLLGATGWRRGASCVFAVMVESVAALALIGYLYGAVGFFRLGAYTSMALHTAANFAVLGGAIFVVVGGGIVEVVWADSAGGDLLRRVLPAAVAIPVMGGWLSLAGERAGWYRTEFAVAVIVAATVGLLAATIGRAALRLDKVDEQRKHLNHNLEGLVEARTAELADTMRALRSESEQRRAAGAALFEATERFRSSFEGAPIGMAIIDGGGMFLEVNEALPLIFGYREPELLTMGLLELTASGDRKAAAEGYLLVGAGSTQKIRNERQYLHADGHTIWAVVAVAGIYDGDGHHRYSVAQVEDVTEIRMAHQTLNHRALHDPLTDLPNRTLLMDRLGQALSRQPRHPGSVAVLFVDLDRFKAINDSLGHDVGDEVLHEIGRRFSLAVRPSDTVARIGGDEFVILAEDLEGEAEAVNVAERLEAALAAPIEVDSSEVAVTASIGIVIAPPGHNSGEDLVRDADTAMYRAKQRGKDRHEVFTDILRRAVTDRLSVEHHLRTAIRDGAITVHYQPIFELGTGRVASVEALVRLTNSDGTLMPPDQFIGVAEDCGLVIPLGAAVLAKACHQQQAWVERFGPTSPDRMAVNLSARELARPGLLETFLSALDDAGLDGHRVCIELTETTLMEATPSVLKTIGALKDLGITLSLDDFGTGYSSLTYLKHFPVDTVKIDRSFVSGLVTDPDDTAIVEAVVSLAHTLGLAIIAEGVETEQQARALDDFGCSYAQGYLWAKPLPPDQLEVLLQSSRTASSLVLSAER